MSPSITRRGALQSGGVVLGTALAGCSSLFGEGDVDVTIRNEHTESHTVSVAIAEFAETVSLAPADSETFRNAITPPTYPTTADATIELDDEVTLESITLGKELEALVVTITTDGDLQAAQKGW